MVNLDASTLPVVVALMQTTATLAAPQLAALEEPVKDEDADRILQRCHQAARFLLGLAAADVQPGANSPMLYSPPGVPLLPS